MILFTKLWFQVVPHCSVIGYARSVDDKQNYRPSRVMISGPMSSKEGLHVTPSESQCFCMMYSGDLYSNRYTVWNYEEFELSTQTQSVKVNLQISPNPRGLARFWLVLAPYPIFYCARLFSNFVTNCQICGLFKYVNVYIACAFLLV